MRKIGIAFLIGIAFIYWLQQTELITTWVSATITTKMQQELRCLFITKVDRCNLLTATITLQPTTATGTESRWQLTTERITIKWSWLWLFWHNHLSLKVALDEVTLQSDCRNGMPYFIQDLIESLAQANKVTVDLRSLYVTNARIQLHDPEYGTVHGNGALHCIKQGSVYKAEMIGNDNALITAQRTIPITEFRLQTTIQTQPELQIQGELLACPWLTTPIQFTINTPAEQNYAIQASWQQTTCSGSISKQTTGYDFTGTIRGNYQDLATLLAIKSASLPINGTAIVTGSYTQELQCQGTVTATYSDMVATIPFTYAQNSAQGTATIAQTDHPWITGNWHYNHDSKKLVYTVESLQKLLVPLQRYWHIPTKKLTATGTMQLQDLLRGSLDIKSLVVHDKAQISHEGRLRLRYGHDKLTAEGAIGSYALTATIPALYEGTISITNDKQQEIAGIVWQPDATKTVSLHAWSDISLVRAVINDAWADYVRGKGILQLHGCHRQGELQLTAAFGEGSVFIANTYNMINSADAIIHYNIATGACSIPQATVKLHKGSISIQQGRLQLSRAMTIEKATIPIVIQHSLLSWKKAYAVTSGKLILSQQINKPWHLLGNILLHKGQITNNILSPEFQQNFAALKLLQNPEKQGMTYDVRIATKKPLVVKTSSISTESSAQLRITGTSTAPICLGEIQVHGGTITFPYKELTIDHGSVQFTKEHTLDPLVSLRAHGTIKRYNIVLTVTGTTAKPQLQLQATPTLSQAQISALLLVGSPDAALNAMAPALIVDNLKQLVVGSLEQSSNAKQRLSSLLEPLKHIKITPQLHENSGKKSLMGGIDIQLSDRLHASVHKDLTSESPATFDLDYEVVDDVSLRAVQDERGDLGAEVEMKWKF